MVFALIFISINCSVFLLTQHMAYDVIDRSESICQLILLILRKTAQSRIIYVLFLFVDDAALVANEVEYIGLHVRDCRGCRVFPVAAAALHASNIRLLG